MHTDFLLDSNVNFSAILQIVGQGKVVLNKKEEGRAHQDSFKCDDAEGGLHWNSVNNRYSRVRNTGLRLFIPRTLSPAQGGKEEKITRFLSSKYWSLHSLAHVKKCSKQRDSNPLSKVKTYN